MFDKPAQSRLVITSSLESAAGSGLLRGVTFGAVNNHPSEPVMHDAAEAYLKSTGRICTLQPGQLIAQPQREFKCLCG